MKDLSIGGLIDPCFGFQREGSYRSGKVVSLYPLYLCILYLLYLVSLYLRFYLHRPTSGLPSAGLPPQAYFHRPTSTGLFPQAQDPRFLDTAGARELGLRAASSALTAFYSFEALTCLLILTYYTILMGNLCLETMSPEE